MGVASSGWVRRRYLVASVVILFRRGGCVVVTWRFCCWLVPSGWVCRRDLAFLLLVGAVGVVRRRCLWLLLLGCSARVDVGIDPYGDETVMRAFEIGFIKVF